MHATDLIFCPITRVVVHIYVFFQQDPNLLIYLRDANKEHSIWSPQISFCICIFTTRDVFGGEKMRKSFILVGRECQPRKPVEDRLDGIASVVPTIIIAVLVVVVETLFATGTDVTEELVPARP